MVKDWYKIQNIDTIDSPSVVLYKKRLKFNIRQMVSLVDGNVQRLMPHVKTNKMPEVMKLLLDSGIANFKASTIAEAEVAAKVGAKSVLLAHQLVGPKVDRFLRLKSHFPSTDFATILDNAATTDILNQKAIELNLVVPIYIDINNGMNRSGIELGPALDRLVTFLNTCKGLRFQGLHVYDGHLRDSDFALRNQKIEKGLESVNNYFKSLKENYPDLKMICGGTPSFTSHLQIQDRITSPGTCVLWDWGYGEKLTEQNFKYAALLITRVISKPALGIVTVDLGHKSVAPENPIDKRVRFLNLENYELLSQSEEHGVLKVSDWEVLNVGDVLYGVPYHICPTINLHDEVSVIENGAKVGTWEITARKRRLSI